MARTTGTAGSAGVGAAGSNFISATTVPAAASAATVGATPFRATLREIVRKAAAPDAGGAAKVGSALLVGT